MTAESFDELKLFNQTINKADYETFLTEICTTNEELKTSIRDVRSKMMDHYKENSESISVLDKELKKLISKEVNQLTNSKVDRKSLAVYLSDIALKLSETQE